MMRGRHLAINYRPYSIHCLLLRDDTVILATTTTREKEVRDVKSFVLNLIWESTKVKQSLWFLTN